MEEKLKLKYPVIVEGRYDKAKVCLVVSTPVITLDGFQIFNNQEKKLLLKRLSRESGIILLTDSDKAGNFIRSKLKGIIKGTVYNVYVPAVEGKERRKKTYSADGLLGVEGIDTDIIRRTLEPFADSNALAVGNVSKARFYEDGFSGGADSSSRRAKLASVLNLPSSLSSKALLEAINLLITEEEYERAVKTVNEEQ